MIDEASFTSNGQHAEAGTCNPRDGDSAVTDIRTTAGSGSNSLIEWLRRSRETFLDRHWEAHDWVNRFFSGATCALHDETRTLIKDHARGLVLDAGAGRGAWRRTILQSGATYESIDMERRGEHETTWLGNIEEMPQVPSERYDTVFCQQVLEHTPRPNQVLLEFSRILKPGGRLLLGVPHLSRRHELPNDYFRYTQEGLSYLVVEAGFKLDRLATYGGILSFLHHQTSFFFPGILVGIPVVAEAAIGVNAPISWLASKLDPWIDRGALLPLGILIVAEKPDGPAG